MAVKTIEELFIHELSDIHSAERQMTKALPRLARAATNPELVQAFETHLEETQGQIERLDKVVELLDIRLKRIKCAAMEGLVEESKEIIDAIPATNPELVQAFETHLEETQGQIERLDKVVELLDIRLKRIKCAAMEGLVEESKAIIDAIPAGALRDAALIGGAQKVEHYEIAAYGTVCALAKQLGYTEALELLLETLEEEKATDSKLTLLAEQGGNEAAAEETSAGRRRAA